VSGGLDRRQWLGACAGAGLAGPSRAMSQIQTFPSVATAVSALEALGSAARTRSGWPLPLVLQHLAQSVEFSIQGFPEMRSAFFRATAGRAAFAVFDLRGRMSHGLGDPIPGAPALADVGLEAARGRLLGALQAFEAHTGALAPHFAYGALDKAAYRRAHLMHIADHWTEIQTA
jgi:hypothetical protein